MTVTTGKKTAFTPWLQYCENLCRDIYADNPSYRDDLEALYDAGVRITVARMFRGIAESTGHSPELFTEILAGFVPPAVREFAQRPVKGLTLDLFPDPGFPGRFFEETLRFRLAEDKKKCVRLARSTNRRQSGSYYTPGVITRYIARETLTPLLRGRRPEEILELRVWDPAMGTGNFLAAAFDILSDHLHAQLRSPDESSGEWREWRSALLSRCLYGIDREPFPVAVSRAHFALKAGVPPDTIPNLRTADSLLGPLPFDGDFDAVIGNPPWISFGLRNTSALGKRELAVYRELFPGSAEYKVSLFALFMEKALTKTRDGGYHGFIVPDSWLTGKYYARLRRFVLRSAGIRQLILIQRDFWEHLNIGRCTLYIMQKNRVPDLFDSFAGAILPSPAHLGKARSFCVPVGYDRIRNRERSRIVLYANERSKRLAEAMEDSGEALGDFIRFYSGLIGKKGRNSIVFEEMPDDYTERVYGKLIESGRNLQKGRLSFRHHYIRRDPMVYKSGYDPRKYESPKLFVNQTGFILKAFHDTHGYFCLNNLHIAYPARGGADLRFYSVLLNSRLMNFYYRTMSMEQGRALAQTDIDFLERLPVGVNTEYYDEILHLLDRHYREETITENASVKHAVSLPDAVSRTIETLLARWYGVEDFR